MTTVEIPDPLATALRRAARWMTLGGQDSTTVAKTDSLEDYRDLLKAHRKLVLPFLRQEVEGCNEQLTVREVDRGAVAQSSPMFRYFAICERGGLEAEVTDLSEPGLVRVYSIGVEPRFSRIGVVVLNIPL